MRDHHFPTVLSKAQSIRTIHFNLRCLSTASSVLLSFYRPSVNQVAALSPIDNVTDGPLSEPRIYNFKAKSCTRFRILRMLLEYRFH